MLSAQLTSSRHNGTGIRRAAFEVAAKVAQRLSPRKQKLEPPRQDVDAKTEELCIAWSTHVSSAQNMVRTYTHSSYKLTYYSCIHITSFVLWNSEGDVL